MTSTPHGSPIPLCPVCGFAFAKHTVPCVPLGQEYQNILEKHDPPSSDTASDMVPAASPPVGPGERGDQGCPFCPLGVCLGREHHPSFAAGAPEEATPELTTAITAIKEWGEWERRAINNDEKFRAAEQENDTLRARVSQLEATIAELQTGYAAQIEHTNFVRSEYQSRLAAERATRHSVEQDALIVADFIVGYWPGLEDGISWGGKVDDHPAHRAGVRILAARRATRERPEADANVT